MRYWQRNFVANDSYHKWCGGAKGSAFLHARDEVQHLIEPLIVGHGWFPDKKSEKPLIDYVEQFGTRDPSAFLDVPAALDYMAQHNWPAVRQQCFNMALAAKRDLEQHFDTEAICPETFEWFSQLCPIHLPDATDMGKLGQILRDQYQIEMPMINWNGVKIARLSVQIYTTQEEIDTFIAAVKKHLPECLNSNGE